MRLCCWTLSDVTLVVEGTEIPAHRGILSARSDYFKAMFAHPMSESVQGVVHLDDVTLPVFRRLLRCVVVELFQFVSCAMPVVFSIST